MPRTIVWMCIYASEGLLSLYLNSFIFVFHLKSFRNGVKLNPSGLLQLVMGATNLSMRGLMLGTSILTLFLLVDVGKLYRVIMIIIPFHLKFSYWLIAWLCAYYCTTITNIRIFTWMKRILVSFLPHLLFLSVVVSFILPVLSVLYLQVQISDDNSTLSNGFRVSIPDSVVLLVMCFCSFPPFLVTLGALVVTMSSLFRHIRKVKKNDSGFAPPNLQAHVSAVRTMILFLLLALIVNVAEIVKLMGLSFFNFSMGTAEFIIWLLAVTFPSAEAAIIIQSSRKLKKRFLQMFCAGRLTGGRN
ncbi:taste receptor type 2 member 4-like [Rana temporaria]|uniref:taste receptor type 2 member 4-like n=1 Tax=Rana temporaria TaxID=8407 RepID=UPI001AADCDC8|nr:taste receptor type 2 member 4-like [Rana temporaria]